METFVGALGTVIAVYVLLRTEIGGLRDKVDGLRSEFRTELRDEIGGLRSELREEIGGLRGELQAGFAAVNARIDQLVVEFARHVHEGHPPNQAA